MVVAGGSIGGLILPNVYRYLLDTYGLRGALLLTGGIIAHCIPGSMLLRPMEFYKKTKQDQSGDIHMNDSTFNNDTKTLTISEPLLYTGNTQNHDIGTKPTLFKNGAKSSVYGHLLDIQIRERSGTDPFTFKRGLSNGHHTADTHNQAHSNFSSNISLGDVYSASIASLSQVQFETTNGGLKIEEASTGKSACRGLIKLDLRCLKYPFVRLFLFVYSVGSVGGAYGHIYITAFAKDQGVDDLQISMLVSMISGFDFVGRVACGIIADCDCIRKTHLMTITMCIAGAVMMISPFFYAFWHFVIFSMCQGLFAGGMFALSPVILMEFLGMEKFRGAMGLNVFIQGISMITSAPFIGE